MIDHRSILLKSFPYFLSLTLSGPAIRMVIDADSRRLKQFGKERIDRDAGLLNFLPQVPERGLRPVLEEEVHEPFGDPPFRIAQELRVDMGPGAAVQGTKHERHIDHFAAKIPGGLVAGLQDMDRRANPVLFDQTTFSDLLQLEGDVGGLAIFHKYRVDYLPWHNDRLLLDVDTPEQYQRLIKDDTL